MILELADPATDRQGSGRDQAETFRYARSPIDALHVVVYVAVTLSLVTLSVLVERSILGFEQDIVQLFNFLSASVERLIAGTMQLLLIVFTLGTLLVPLFTHRNRLFGYVLAANASAGLLCWGAERLVDRGTTTHVINEIAAKAGRDVLGVSNVYPLAMAVAGLGVVGPFVTRRWHRAGTITISAVVLMRLLVSYQLPISLATAVPLGAACGAGTLLAFGRPDRRPTIGAIHLALRTSGLPVAEVRAAKVDARGSAPYFATLEDGRGLFVKVLGADQRAADLLFRIYRFLRLKNIGDDRPFSSLRRTVEHEALVAMVARDIGIRTPRMRGVVTIGSDSMLLAYDLIDGRSLDGMADEAITDDVMRQVWQQVALLRAHRIAHRDLRRANVFVADDGVPWMIDFGFSELAVDQMLLNADVAQMLASFAVVASPERVVRMAVEVIGRDAVAEALPRLQVNALSGATQTALKQQKGRLEELQHEVMHQCNVGDVQFEPLQRINRRTVITLVVVAGATYFLIPQFADLPGIISQVKDANWGWLPVVLLMSAITYVGATFSLGGAVPQHLQVGPLFATQVGSSFASKVAPAGLGGMALNIRFLQKQGVDEPVAVSAVGMNSVAGFIGHMSLIGIFMVWAGSSAFEAFHLPDPKWFIIAILGVVVLAGIGFLIPAVRRLFTTKLLPILRRAVHGVVDVMRHPAKVASLMGGSITVTMSYLLALYFSLQAFGGALPFATTGAVYLVGAAIASAAPTPGGLGAVEAALIAGLVAAGVDNNVAVPAVFLYRLCTFWFPILPGWACFTWLQRRDYI